MRFAGERSWRIGVRRWEQLIESALWIRAVERIGVPAGGLTPGPLDLDPLPPPSLDTVVDAALREQWTDWWASLVDPRGQSRPVTPGALPAPADDTPDPLGLAGRPALARIVARRWREAFDWTSARQQRDLDRTIAMAGIEGAVVREVERGWGRRVRPFEVEFVLLPVRDHQVRRATENRYLVPEQIYASSAWQTWLYDLVIRIG